MAEQMMSQDKSFQSLKIECGLETDYTKLGTVLLLVRTFKHRR